MDILGVKASSVESPASVDEAAAVMARAAAGKQRLAFVGGGTQLELGPPPTGLDTIVTTGKLTRILEYAPADMVMVCEGGVTLEQVQRTAAAHRQRLMLDAPLPARATLGGLVATANHGPLRTRYGGIRDLIIGVGLVRADGSIARGGGKVVKNVAGFDLPKVACGSLGTLGLVATANFRLHPLPETAATSYFPALQVGQVTQIMGAVRAAQLEPAAAVALRTKQGTYDLGLRYEGFDKGVKQQMARTSELAHAAKVPCEPLAEPAGGDFWKRHDAVRESGALRFRVASLPSRLAAVDALLATLPELSFAWYATIGVGFASVEPAENIDITALGAARSVLVAAGGSLVIEAAPAKVRAALDVWGPLPKNTFPMMERLKDNFDPERRLNPGRFVGGL